MSFHHLISATELAPHVSDTSWRVFDCRHDLTDPDAGDRAYRAAHVPGARFLHLDRDLSGATNGRNGRHPLPDPTTLAATLARHGVANDTQVIAYDDAGGAFAARLWWLLRWLGHEHVAVLDGGLQAWQRAGHSLSDALPANTPAKFAWRTGEHVVDSGYVLAHLHDPNMLVIDARSPERFRGENETLDRVGGHIPGAVNRFFKNNLDANGYFKPAAELRHEFDQLTRGRRPQTIVHQCGSGVTACHNLLALEIAGVPGTRLYPGSWSEWCSDTVRPVARGAG